MYCGIDVAKNKSQICFLSNDKKVLSNFEIVHNDEGFHRLTKGLSKDSIIGLETTGVYSQTIYYYLKNLSYNVSYINNNRLKNFSDLQYPTIKNDKIDAQMIAEYLFHNHKRMVVADFNELKDIVRLYVKMTKQLTKYKYMFKSQLNIIFPEIETNYSINITKTIPNLLLLCPSPKELMLTDPNKLLKILKTKVKSNRLNLEFIKGVQELAKKSIGVKDYPTKCFQRTIQLMLFYNELIDELKEEMNILIDKTPYKSLLEISGYATIGVATIIGEIQDIRKFSNHKKFVKYIGLDVTEHQSGTTKKNSYISKKGNNTLRNLFYNLALGSLSRDQELRTFYDKLREKGKHPKKCLTATSRKLAIKTYYHLQKCHNTKVLEKQQANSENTIVNTKNKLMNYSKEEIKK
ncbi:IS110 family transposase [Bacteroidota bacterium]